MERAKIIHVQAGQSLIDIALQEYGATEGIFLLMMANKGVITSVTMPLVPGTPLTVWSIKLVEAVAAESDSLVPFIPVLMTWITIINNNSGGGGTGGGLNDGDYVHIRGDEVVDGIKSFLQVIKTNAIEEKDSSGVSIEGVTVKDNTLFGGSY